MVPTYLDPGSGSLFLQLLVGGAAGLGFAMKHYWKNIRYFLSAHLASSQKSPRRKDLK
jgi:hypothetical protein